jgi:hypothetical protein
MLAAVIVPHYAEAGPNWHLNRHSLLSMWLLEQLVTITHVGVDGHWICTRLSVWFIQLFSCYHYYSFLQICVLHREFL